MDTWQDRVISFLRQGATNQCANCTFFRAKNPGIYVEDHCSDTVSPFKYEHVQPDWWCPMFNKMKPS